jgi:peptidylprolyl isomerase
MKLRSLRLAVLALALLGLAGPMAAGASTWHPLDPAATLVIDTTKGRILVEMRPELAPRAVERVILLAREGVYDGLLFHRVIDHFVDQTGNPNNKDGGTSSHPDLAPEFTFPLAAGGYVTAATSTDGIAGFVGALPIAGGPPSPSGGKQRGWAAYCAGVVGMGRQEAPGSANSEIFFMRDAARRLDHDYTAFGRVVVGLDVVRAVAVGEPPAAPDRMMRVRLLADLPDADRPHVERMDEHDPAFAALIAKTRAAEGADFSVCDVEIPVRSAP